MTKAELKTAIEDFNMRCKFIKEATYEKFITESTEDQEKRIKRLLKPENYLEFFDYYFGMNAPVPLADAPCAEFHLKSYVDLFNNRLIKQQRRWFRGAAKSIHTNVGNVTHLKQNNELKFGLMVGKTEGLAKILLSDLQSHLEFNERIIKDFGVQMQYGNWADGQFQTKDGNFFMALGLNQPFRGIRKGANRPDFVSIDDVEDRKQAKNIELTKENVQKLTGDLGKAGQKGRFRQVMANNYIVKNGIIDGWAEKYKKSKNFKISTVNLCDHNFNPTWKERYTKEECEEIVNDSDYYTSQREDFNNPVEEGKRFKEKWIRFKKTHGNKHWDCLVEFWDLSYKKEGDHKAGVIIGFEKGRAHVLEIFNRQCEESTAMDMHYQWQEKYQVKGMSINTYYDASVAQRIIFEPNWFKAAERNNGNGIPLPDYAAGDKHERIVATLETVFFNGMITFDDKLMDSEDMEAATTHILAFEKGCKTPDDILDAIENSVRKGGLLFGTSTKDNESSRKAIIKKRERGGF
ncbi:hypothetical protein PL373_07980 [Tenacibaculum maritimum]|nr:hypothetical protein [Tenacibaculum maritimum]MDB0601084.1 hypothetical protein [Tenacibaculum maritimum]MDB0612165.1 hypothetical protein [Tenacibaculum maritimum]